MGTSQSHKLLKAPMWSEAKRAMTQVIVSPSATNIQKYLDSFFNALSLSSASASARNAQTWTSRGSEVLGGFIDYIASVQAQLNDILDQESFQGLSKQETLIKIYNDITDKSDTTTEDIAAKAALSSMLNMIFNQCEDINDIRQEILQASPEKIEEWATEYIIEYILEINCHLFYDHIFSKEKDPEITINDIRAYMRQEVGKKLANKSISLGVLMKNSRQYVNDLTNEIIAIWK